MLSRLRILAVLSRFFHNSDTRVATIPRFCRGTGTHGLESMPGDDPHNAIGKKAKNPDVSGRRQSEKAYFIPPVPIVISYRKSYL